jgi:uncharacterized protein YacL
MENNLKNKHENMLWYIFLFSNVSILFGIVISWIITIRTEGINNYYILLIFNLISIILSAIFYFFETKEFVIKKFHVKEK